ncbi:hypothetical protein CK203_065731 [Vitis vinifera]|uniref:Uncharacterized protein n=1 Tax=Vitis vinifera TaxID=29760 RepID=A0A438G3T8_VITVI|nr:hypothetical protein CK203_065731 [Vitis vinifera]
MAVRKLLHHLMLDQLHEANHWQNIYAPPNGKGCVGCDTGNILRCQECFPNLRTQDTTLADEARRSGSHGILHEMLGAEFSIASRCPPSERSSLRCDMRRAEGK